MSDDLHDILDPIPDPQPPQPDPAPRPIHEADDIHALLDSTPTAQPTLGMHAASASAVAQGLKPAQAAQASTLAARAGVDPDAVVPVQQEVAASAAQAFDARNYQGIAERHPELARWLTKPTNAAIASGDLANLRALSGAIKAINPPTDTRPDLPLLSAFRMGVVRSVTGLNRTLLAGPAWLEKETRDLFGVTSDPGPGFLSLFHSAGDIAKQQEQQRADWFQPSAARDLVGQVSGILADPTTSILLPAEGASLAIKGTLALGEAATAAAAIKGAAMTQAAVGTGQTLIAAASKSPEEQAQRGAAANALAETANVAVQGALAYFGGKLGQEIPILRALRATPFTTNVAADLGSDIARNAVVGGTQAVAAGTAEAAINEGRLPSAAELTTLYASGAIPGGLMAAANAPEALVAARHLDAIKHAEGLQFANKMMAVVEAAQRSTSAEHGPEQVGSLIDSVAESGPSHVFLQAEDWQEHFLAQGLDPVAEAAKAGLQEEYVRARGLGTDMRLPLRAAIGMAIDSENPAALMAKVRQAATAPNAVESARFFQTEDPGAIEAAKKLAGEQIAAADGEKPQTIAAGIAEQVAGASKFPESGGLLGQLHQRFLNNLAEHLNEAREEHGGPLVTAEQLAEQFPIAFRRAVPEIIQEQGKSGHLATLLDELRTKGPTTDEQKAAREALLGLGLDPVTQTNEEIAAALATHVDSELAATFEQRVNAEGIRLTSAEALRLRAEAHRRGELDKSTLPGDPTPIMGNPVLPDDLAHLSPEARAFVEGLTPEERAFAQPTIDDRRASTDRAGDLGNVKMGVDAGRRAARKAGATFAAGGSQPHGDFTTGTNLVRLFQGENPSTVYHEWAHYARSVLSKLGLRENAPPKLLAEINGLFEWAGYGDISGAERMLAELAALQQAIGQREPTADEKAKLRELSKPDENIARGLETYLVEGKAPAPGLRRIFARIKSMMLTVYRGIKDVEELGKTLTPEVRSIFDRLFASEREIARAKARVGEEPAFTEKPESMSPKLWAKYQEMLGDTHRQESEKLERELMAHEREATSETYKTMRADVRRQVAEQVGQERVHNAISQLQDGETWDGREVATPIKLRKDAVELMLTEEERARLPGPGREKNRGRPVITPQDTGFHPDDAAKLLDYESGHALLQDLINAPDRAATIEERTDQAMAQRFPDLMKDQGALDKAADTALHETDARAALFDFERHHLAKLLEAERSKAAAGEQKQALGAAADQAQATVEKQAGQIADALGRQALRQATSHDERLLMRFAAGEMIGDAKVSAVDPDRYIAAERKAALASAKAIATKDYATALTQKRAQMMNAELARAAHAAQEQVRKDSGALLKSATDDHHRQTIGKAGGWEWTVTYPDGQTKTFDAPDEAGKSAQEQARAEAINSRGTYDRTSGYLDQVDALLEGFEFKDISPKEARRRATLAQFLEKVRFFKGPDGDTLPTGEFPNIPQRLIDQAGKLSYKDMTVNDLHDLRQAVSSIETMAKLKNELIRSTGKHRTENTAVACAAQLAKTSTGIKKRKAGKFAPLDTLLRTIGNFHDEMRLVPVLVHEMDGGRNGGALFKAFSEPQGEAARAELVIKAEGREKVKAALDEWGKSEDIVRTTIPGIDRPFTTLERVVVLMHYGNKEGRQRLADLHGWNDAKVRLIVDSLDAKDIAFANAMVDVLSSHWSDVKALEERYNGIAPPKVEAIPVELPNGSYKGGYQRIYYDGESATALEHMSEQAFGDTLTGQGYRRSTTTPHGATIARVEKVTDRQLSFAPGNWARAFNEMAHDLTHRDLVMNQIKLLRNKTFKDAMIAHWGDGVYRQFVNQTLGIAQGNKPATTSVERVAEYMRISTAYSKRAFNVGYALLQETGLVNARVRVKDKYLASALVQLTSGPLSIDHMARWIAEQDPRMKYRARTRDANFGDALSDTTLSGSARKFMDGAGMFMVTKVWEHLDNVCWKGAYDQHMAESGGNHAESVNVATQVVETVMGSNLQKDLPQVMRSGPMSKVFTSQMQWALGNWGLIEHAWRQTTGGLKKLGSGGWHQMATGLGSLATLMVIGPMLWEFTRDLLKGDDLTDWTTPAALAKKAALSPLSETMSSIPIIRELEHPLLKGDHGGGASGLAWLKGIQGAVAAVHAKHYTEATAKAAVGGAASFLPIPSAAIFQAIEGYQKAQKKNADFATTVWRMMNGPPHKAAK